MKINKALKPQIDELIQVKQINMNIADMLLSIFPYEDIITKEFVNKQTKEGKTEAGGHRTSG